MKSSTTGLVKLILHSRPIHRLLISLFAAAIALFFFRDLRTTPLLLVLICWSAFCLMYLGICSIIFFKKPVDLIQKTARADDGSAAFVFAMVLLCSFAAMFSIIQLLFTKEVSSDVSQWLKPAAVTAVIGSWFMVHTLYTFHYAHRYYDLDEGGKKDNFGGLNFPGDNTPDYIDFAYYSFTIGCTFQVSDVSIDHKTMRRITLGHSILSFVLNTVVLALTINIIAS